MKRPPPAEPALTDAEHRAMALTAELYDLLSGMIVGSGAARDHDLAELARHVHAIQHAVMAQAAARAYPGRYRLLGGSPTPLRESDHD